MTQEKFNELIEHPANVNKDFWERIKIKSAIARTLRLTLQYPEFAQEYYDSLPKAVCENVPTTTNE